MTAAYDVVVAGAGPAGAVAAALLARAGLSVLLCDPRLAGVATTKPGEALPGAAERLLRACGLPVPGARGGHKPIGGNISIWGSPEPIHRDFLSEPDGAGVRLDRAAFEAELVAAAQAAGAEVRPRRLVHAARDAARWQLACADDDRCTAGFLVDASGRVARLARRLGARRHRDEPLVAVVGRGRADPVYRLDRTLVETVPEGWWYAARLPDGAPVFMLHTRPADAARLVARPEAWRAALAATRHVAAAFPDAVLDAPRAHDAGGAQLDPVHGPGWVAVGDAAQSFDPAAAQGIFSALWGGMTVAQAIPAALRGDAAGLRAYAATLTEIRRIYRARSQAHYADERRWPEAPFWRERLAAGA